jgi:acetylornithine deacetylase
MLAADAHVAEGVAVPHPEVARDVLDAVRRRRPEMIELLSELVAAPTLSGDERLAEPAFEAWFAGRGWRLDRQVLSETRMAESESGRREPRLDERANLVGWLDRPATTPHRRLVTLNAHYDVVPVIDEADWHSPPFEPTLRGDAIYGRGTVDNKAGCVTALYALQVLADAGVSLDFDLAVELIAGEETTGLGTVASLEAHPNRLATVVLEPTENAVVPVNSGALFFTIEVTGWAVHTSTPWKGEDALERLVRIYGELQKLGAERAVSHVHPLMAGLPSSVPLVVGVLNGGGWRAALPAHGTLSGRIGILPGEPIDDVKQALAEAVRRAGDGDAWLTEHPPVLRFDNDGLPGWELDQQHELVRSLACGQRAAGEPESIVGITTGCDAGILHRAGVPVVVFGPGELSRAHSANEFVTISEIERAVATLALGLAALSDEQRGIRS